MGARKQFTPECNREAVQLLESGGEILLSAGASERNRTSNLRFTKANRSNFLRSGKP
jgi:hypothetical protein